MRSAACSPAWRMSPASSRGLKELGRTPVQHLTYIRMQRAQHLLETTNDKIEAIAAETGYDGAMVFSRAFKRWLGVTPSDYRARRGQ